VSLRDDLVRFLRDADVDLPDVVDDGTSLVVSGRVDSLALFHLAAWVEKEVGAPVDPATVDLPTAWETIGDVVRFVERRRTTPRPGP
jgi:acyl carrier protein